MRLLSTQIQSSQRLIREANIFYIKYYFWLNRPTVTNIMRLRVSNINRKNSNLINRKDGFTVTIVNKLLLNASYTTVEHINISQNL